MREFNKNKIIIPVMLLTIITAGYVASKLSKEVKPMTLDEYESRYAVPAFPKPVVSK